MTVEEMKKKIKKECDKYTHCEDCPLLKMPENSCWINLTNGQIKRNYEIMFEKEETEMKNEFDFNELKAGYAIKVPAYEDNLLVGIPNGEDLIFYSENFNCIVSKKNILIDTISEKYIPTEVYGFSSDGNLFDPSTRPLLWKKEENKNFKKYEIGNLIIEPNDTEHGYKTEDDDFVFIENLKDSDSIVVYKSELNDVIEALTEIKDFIKED